MSFHQVMKISGYRLEELQQERRAIAQARWAGRPDLARRLAHGLRRLAAALDGEHAPRRYAAAR